jgi:hypothetical protein
LREELREEVREEARKTMAWSGGSDDGGRRWMGRRLFTVSLASSVFLSATAGGQSATISGVVSDARNAAPVANAVVMWGSVAGRTDPAGRFRFDGVTLGRHQMEFRALGYVAQRRMVDVHGDTVLAIRLERRVTTLDTMMIRGRSATVHVEAVDAGSRSPLLFAEVTVFPGGQTVGGRNGRVTVHDVPAGTDVQLSVEAFEYLPTLVDLSLQSDTAIRVMMRPDSALLRVARIQAARLRRRSNSIQLPIDDLNRDDVRASRAGTVGEMLRRHLGSATRKLPGECVFLDDRKIDVGVLDATLPDVIERIEIYGRGRMIRVYTTSYVFGLARLPSLPHPVYIPGRHLVCD